MALETGTYISDLVSTNPVAGDPVSQADDHLRLIKSTVLATFPNINGAVTATPTQLNRVTGSSALLINRAYAEYTTNADIATAIPLDDTIPQVGEGTQILSVAITPVSNTSRLRIRFNGFGSVSALNDVMVAAIFVNGAANAVAAGFGSNAPAAGTTVNTTLEYEYVPGSTAAQTITVRVGPTTGTLRLNGTTAARRLGGAARSTVVVEEFAV